MAKQASVRLNDLPDLQKRLGDELAKPGRSQSALARRLGMDASGVNRLVHGQRELKVREVEIIEAYLAETEEPSVPSSAVSANQMGETIRRLREERGMSQAQLAAAVGTAQQTVDRVERGETMHSRALAPILEFLGIDAPATVGSRSPLALRVAGRLRDLGMSPREASLKAGLGPDAIRSIFNGSSAAPRADTIVALAQVLQCSVGTLVGENAPIAAAATTNRDAITITQSESGMWFATRENDRPIFVGARSLEDLCAMLPEAVSKAAPPPPVSS